MRVARLVFPALLTLVIALTPTASWALGGFPGGFGGGGGGAGGGGGGAGGGGAAGGGPAAAPLPALGATLIGQGVVLAGGYLMYRRRQQRLRKKP